MEGALEKVKLTIKNAILLIMPTFFWIIFSVKRVFSINKRFGFLNEEFFSRDFIDNGICDIGGFGMTATVISQYYNHKRCKGLEATILLSRVLPVSRGWENHINGTLVLSIPNVNIGRVKTFLKYSLCTNKNLKFLLSIDMYPFYEYSLNAMPNTPLVIWIRDPKSEDELNKIGTVDCEITANNKKSIEEFNNYAKEERQFFKRIHKKAKIFNRPIVFATNAKFLTPRARRLYGLKELDSAFLPNPIHYPDYSKIKKSTKPMVCLLGRLDPVKRPWIFFELAKRFKNVDFLVCGQSSYPGTMNPIIEKYHSVENLKFLGLVEGKNKEDILSKSWLLVNTSIHEGLPCSFLESFAYGTPIISSVNPDDLVSKFGFYTGENLGDGTDDSTMNKFEEGLDKLFSDKKGLKRLGLEARRHIEKIYNFDMFEESLKNIFSGRFRKNYATQD